MIRTLFSLVTLLFLYFPLLSQKYSGKILLNQSPVRKIIGHGNLIYAATGTSLAIVNSKGESELYDFHSSTILSMALSEDSTHIYTGDLQGNLFTTNLETKKTLQLTGSESRITAIADGDGILAIADLQSIKLCQISPFKVLKQVPLESSIITSMVYIPKVKKFLAADNTGSILVFSLSSENQIKLQVSKSLIRDISYNPNNDRVYLVGNNRKILYLPLDNLRDSKKYKNAVYKLSAFDYANDVISYGGLNGKVSIDIFTNMYRISYKAIIDSPINDMVLILDEFNRYSVFLATETQGLVLMEAIKMVAKTN